MLERFENPQHQVRSRELEQAFASFNDVSVVLAEVYRDLESRVSSLNSELLQARHERLRQYQEKERIACRLQNLLDALPAGVIVLDGDGLITEHNPAAADLLGLPLQGETWRDVVKRSFAPRWDDGHDLTLVDDRCVNISTQSLEKDSGQLVLIKEVTETKQLQRQLAQFRRLSAMGEMASALAHQIRTPLSSALLYASNLKNPQVTSSRKERFTDKLVDRLRHLESLVEDMLLFARGGNFDFSCYSLKEVMDEFAGLLGSAEHSKQLSLHIDPVPADIQVNINRNAFISILQNLLDNALQVCGTDTRVRIVTEITSPGFIDLLVIDNGPGIAEEIKAKIFEPFYTTRQQGTGLGLAVVDSVIRSHGGSISLDTGDHGTTFRLRLPIAPGWE